MRRWDLWTGLKFTEVKKILFSDLEKKHQFEVENIEFKISVSTSKKALKRFLSESSFK